MRKRSQSIQIKLCNQDPVPIQLIDNTLLDSSLENNSNQHESVNTTLTVKKNDGNLTDNENISLNTESSAYSSPISPMSPMARNWVTNVRIGDCSIVRGTVSTYKYVVWTIKIDTVLGTTITIYKRYSDFEKLRQLLVKYYPKELGSDRAENRSRSNSLESTIFGGTNEYGEWNEGEKLEIAKLPGKRILGDNLEVSFLNHRRNGLEYFLSSVLLNPKFCNSGVVKEWLLQ